MKKTLLTIMSIPFTLGASYAADKSVELIVKYKSDNNKVMSMKSVPNDYSIVREISPTKKIIKVESTISTPSSTNLVSSNSTNNPTSTADEYAIAKKFMVNHPEVIYAIPKNAKAYAINSNIPSSTIQSTSAYSEWNKQWDMMDTSAGIGADQAWDKAKNINDVYVAVLDTGIATDAPIDITNKLDTSNTYYFYNNGLAQRNIYDQSIFGIYHGTHVAGTIAANGPGVVGVAGPLNNVKVIPVRVLNDNGNGYINDIITAIEWVAGNNVAVNDVATNRPIEINQAPVKVINLSLGLSRLDAGVLPANWDNIYLPVLCPAYEDAINTAKEKGITVVIAAGNDPISIHNEIPAGCKNMGAVIVEASGPTGKISAYSSSGSEADNGQNIVIRAPGGDYNAINPDTKAIYGQEGEIYSTINGFGYLHGTSMAAPHVAGIAALIYSTNPDADVDFISNVLKNSSNPKNASIVSAKTAVEYSLSQLNSGQQAA